MRKFMFYLCIIVLLLTGIPVCAVTFSDLNQSHWAYENIMRLSNAKIVNGYEDGTFRPENMVTYGEFMKLVICSYLPEDKILNIEGKHWALKYVYTAEVYELISIGSISIENLDKPITRMNMVKFLAIIDKNMTTEEYVKTKELDFTDIYHLPREYCEYLERVVNKGYILGNPDKTFKPEENLTRAEMVTILTRL